MAKVVSVVSCAESGYVFNRRLGRGRGDRLSAKDRDHEQRPGTPRARAHSTIGVMANDTRDGLERFFAPHNHLLSAVLGAHGLDFAPWEAALPYYAPP